MTFKVFEKRYFEIRKKHDILLLADLLNLYDERYKSKKGKVPVRYIYNELHDGINYPDNEIEIIISEALKLKNEQK